jgi:hypothetical protein
LFSVTFNTCSISHPTNDMQSYRLYIPIFSVSKSWPMLTVFAMNNNTHFQNFFLSQLHHNFLNLLYYIYVRNLIRQFYLYRPDGARTPQPCGQLGRHSNSPPSCVLYLFAALNEQTTARQAPCLQHMAEESVTFRAVLNKI